MLPTGTPALEEESVRVRGRLLRRHDLDAVDLRHAGGSRLRDTGRMADSGQVLRYAPGVVADAESQIERGVGSAARAAPARRNAEPSSLRERLRWLPDRELGHDAKPARIPRATQALLIGAILLAGCARVPKVETGTAARDRFLSAYAAPHSAPRGVGSISIRRGKEGRGGARARWGSSAESLAVVGYVGPARVLDASLRGEELFLVIRRYGMGVQGTLSGEEGIDGRILRFAATPWDFSAPWVRRELERAAVRESGERWRLEGTFHDPGPGGDYRFQVGLTARGEPESLSLQRPGESREVIGIRYGPERRYEAGRIPSWIEWSFSGSVVMLQVEDHAPPDPAKIRYGT